VITDAWTIRLDASPMQRDSVRVKWQYQRAANGEWETVGTLHLTRRRLLALLSVLRAGAANLLLTGSYFEQHPELRRPETSYA
jgi:hypothetical protein